jgi:hypothetical protein
MNRIKSKRFLLLRRASEVCRFISTHVIVIHYIPVSYFLMERSPSAQYISTSTEEQRNGSIFRRMYNSLHRPKKGADPFVDVANRFEQEQIQEQKNQQHPGI